MTDNDIDLSNALDRDAMDVIRIMMVKEGARTGLGGKRAVEF